MNDNLETKQLVTYSQTKQELQKQQALAKKLAKLNERSQLQDSRLQDSQDLLKRQKDIISEYDKRLRAGRQELQYISQFAQQIEQKIKKLSSLTDGVERQRSEISKYQGYLQKLNISQETDADLLQRRLQYVEHSNNKLQWILKLTTQLIKDQEEYQKIANNSSQFEKIQRILEKDNKKLISLLKQLK